jgi:transcriptional regulator with XRE-family HTH domain
MAAVAHDQPDRERDRLFGARVRRYRRAADYSQASLAEMLDIHLLTVSRWERGENKPDINGLYRLAAALGVQVRDLLPEADETT